MDKAYSLAKSENIPYLSFPYDGALRPDTVSSSALVRGDNTVCFVNHADRAWELPGGKVEQDETPRQAAFRECAEETGMKPQSVDRLCIVSLYNDRTTLTKHVWIATEWRQTQAIDESEIDDVAWFNSRPDALSFAQYEDAVLSCISFPR